VDSLLEARRWSAPQEQEKPVPVTAPKLRLKRYRHD
jgi:hypothetical protein